MSLDSIVEARIHPAIGVARVGNSDEYFVGPEVPNPVAPPEGGYRDKQGRLKRQAARFRVYGYDSHGQVVAELTAANARIAWTVHVANKKAAWYCFDAALDLPDAATLQSARRNSQIQGKDREKLAIDPGPRSVAGRNEKSNPFDTGRFFDIPVYLGELCTDDEGRLLFIGGLGKSDSPLPGYTLTTFANNPGWHDDTSDGPVNATVKIGERTIPVDGAWVVTAPPNYSPDLVTPQTMHDVIRDAMAGSIIPRPVRPSFTQDILPLLRQFNDAQWVNEGFFTQFGWQGPNDFMRPDVLPKLAAAPIKDEPDPLKADPFGEMRRQIFYSFRDPNSSVFEPLQWPPLYGDAFGSFDSPPSPRAGYTFTPTIYKFLSQWMQGDFDADYKPDQRKPKSLADVPLPDQPGALDKAALHFCMGGPFHPGCEMTWPMRHSSMYRSPYRLRERPAGSGELDYGEFLTQVTISASDGPLAASGPGDITRWMAVPWQSDTASCRAGYKNTEFPADPFIPTFWPSRVPNNVLTEASYKVVVDPGQPMDARVAAFHYRPYWLASLGFEKPYIEQITYMIHHFGDLAVVERREHDAGPEFPKVMYVATSAEGGPVQLMRAAPASPQAAPVSEEFARARFGGLRR